MTISAKKMVSTAILRLTQLDRKSAIVAAAIALSTAGLLPPAALALSQRELYQICSRYPRNSNCEGYEAPIALKQREGTLGECNLRSEEQSLKGRCKVEVTKDSVVAYIETGSRLSLLDGEQSTKTIAIEPESIRNLLYETDLPPLNAAEINAAQFLQAIGMGLQLAGGGIPTSYPTGTTNATASQVTVQYSSAEANDMQLEAQSADITVARAASIPADITANAEDKTAEDISTEDIAAEETVAENINVEVGQPTASDSSTISQTTHNSSLSFKSSPQKERQIRESIYRLTGLVPAYFLEEDSEE